MLSDEWLDIIQKDRDENTNDSALRWYCADETFGRLMAQAREANRLRAENARMREVVEAAKAFVGCSVESHSAAHHNLFYAVDRLPATPPEREEASGG